MVGTSDEKLMNLHDALKLEFEKVQRSYIGALDQLETLALVNSKVNNKGQMNGFGSKAPIAQSHQRQLSLKVGVHNNLHKKLFFLFNNCKLNPG